MKPISRSAPRDAAVALTIAIALSAPRDARADETARQRAGALYDRGAAAQARGDHAEAARLFTRADDALPNEVALEAALGAVTLADEVALGMELAERAASRVIAGKLATKAADVRRRFAPRAGRVIIECPPAVRCAARIDGAHARPGDARWASVGIHRVEIDAGSRSEASFVTVEPGRTARVTIREVDRAGPGAPGDHAVAPAASSAPEGLSPGWFWLGAGLTAAAGLATAASYADTASRHDAFVAHPTREAAADGEAAQTRSLALLGVSAGLLATTTVVGVAFVRWTGPARTAPVARAVTLGFGAGGFLASGRF